MTGQEALDALRIRLWLLALDVDRGPKTISLMSMDEAAEFDMTEVEVVEFNKAEAETDYLAEYDRHLREWEAYCLLFKAVDVELSIAYMIENGPQHDLFSD